MKKINKWFTLVELLVVISLIIIIILALTNFNFNKLSDEQKSEIFANKILSEIETLRDDSISWKWTNDTNSPSWFKNINKRTLELEKWENKNIISKLDNQIKINLTSTKKEKIENLKCWDIEKNKIKIEFYSDNIIFFDENDIECKDKIKIIIDFNNKKNEIVFDRVSWLVKSCKNSCK